MEVYLHSPVSASLSPRIESRVPAITDRPEPATYGPTELVLPYAEIRHLVRLAGPLAPVVR